MLPYIDAPFAAAGSLVGASADELKLLSSFLISYPLAAILKRIPDSQPWQKNAFIVAVSLFYLVGLFDLWDGVRTLLYCAAGTYAIAHFVHGALMPWLAFAYLIAYMSLSHIVRQALDDPSTVDVTGAQMVLVMKLSAFAWNVYDGRQPDALLSDAQRHAAIKQLPSLLDFAGYVLFFPSLLAGPAFDYVEYRRWIETTMFDLPPGVDPSKAPPTRKKRRIPRSGRPAALKAGMGLLFIGAYVVAAPIFTPALLLGDTYASYGFLRRVLVLYLFGFAARLKYYGVWALAEGACILSGMGYNGVDPVTGQVYWNKLENVNPWGLETAQNPHAFLANWNKNTNHWLRNYVYLRVTPRGKKPGFRASLATFATSAVWHGFYPGYYLTFILGSFVQTSAKHFRRHVRPFFLSPDGTTPTPAKPYYDALSWLATQLTMSFTVAPFILLNLPDCLALWSRVYFYAILGIAGTLVFFNSPAKHALTGRLKQRNGVSPAAVREREEAKAKEKKAREIVQPGATPYVEQPLGLPNDLAQDVEDAVAEVGKEIEARRRRGSLVAMPTGAELRAILEERVGRALQ